MWTAATLYLMICALPATGQTPAVTPLPLATPVPAATPLLTPAPTPFGTPVPFPTPAAPSNDQMPVQRSFDRPVRPLPSSERVGVDMNSPLSLSLSEAIERALRSNNDIEVSRNDLSIAGFSLRAAEGVYDPVFNSELYYESRTTPTASTIGGAVNGAVTQRQLFGNAGLSGLIRRGGGSYDLAMTTSRTDTTNRNATLNPQYPSSLIGTFVQPLLRNREIDQNRRTIEVQQRNVGISDAQLRLRAIIVVSTVEQAYWDLTFALRNLQVQLDTLAQAREQLASNQRMVAQGILAPIDVVAAQAQITTFEQQVYVAQEAITRAENTLKTLILGERTAPEWSRPITPVTPVERDVPQIGVEVATTEAIRNRPEITELELQAEINRIDQRFFENQTKPQIDFVASYTSAGLGGTRNPLTSGGANVPDVLVGGLFTSLGNLFLQRFPTYRFGVQISLPLRNRTAKANLGRALAQEDRIENLRQQQEQLIEADVRNSLQATRSSEARLASATEARMAAEELYASEQRQFRGGTTTFYLVLQRQAELSAARGRELQARTDLNRAISVFNRAIGATLTSNSVTVR
jgi:outer membrane protein TolC